jgi:AcrR family transcriptional regulator
LPEIGAEGDTLRERAGRYSPAQRRTIAAALDLFADHGLGGTSFQMIADSVGVTKAAIYHQFKSKAAIVIAVTEVELARLEEALEEAEAAGSSARTRAALLARVIDISVERRRAISTLQNDPAVVRFLGNDKRSQDLWARIFALLLGDDLDEQGRVRAAVLSAAIGSVAHPFVADIDNETLRAALLDTTRRLIAPEPRD